MESNELPNIDEVKTVSFKKAKELEGKVTAIKAQPIIIRDIKERNRGRLQEGFLKNIEGEYMKFNSRQYSLVNDSWMGEALILAEKDNQFAKIKGVYCKVEGEGKTYETDTRSYYKIYGIKFNNIKRDVLDED